MFRIDYVAFLSKNRHEKQSTGRSEHFVSYNLAAGCATDAPSNCLFVRRRHRGAKGNFSSFVPISACAAHRYVYASRKKSRRCMHAWMQSICTLLLSLAHYQTLSAIVYAPRAGCFSSSEGYLRAINKKAPSRERIAFVLGINLECTFRCSAGVYFFKMRRLHGRVRNCCWLARAQEIMTQRRDEMHD